MCIRDRGNTLEAKLDSVRGFIAGDDAQTDKADKVLSYLVFLKTMAEVFQQYSPSGSGFLLEAFLAGLMKGKQIVDTEEGTLPIVDYTTESGDPVSLKRLTGGEKGTPIKGSIKNLSGHIAKNPDRGVDYVIAAIHGVKDGGTIEFTQFNINADTYIEYIGKYLKVPPGISFTQAAGPTGAADNLEANVFQEERALQEVESTADIKARVAKNYPHRVGQIQKALGVNGTEKNPVIAAKNEETGQEMPALKAKTDPMVKLAKTDPGGIGKAANVLVSKEKFLPEMIKSDKGKAGADGFNAVFRDPQGKLQRHWVAANSKEEALKKAREAFPDLDPAADIRLYGKPGVSNIEQAIATLIEFPKRGEFSEDNLTGSYLYPHKSSGPGKLTPEGTPDQATILGAMKLLQSAFKEAVARAPTAGSWFSHGAMSHSTGGGGVGVGAESLAQIPPEQQAAFPAWLRENPEEFMALVNYSIGRAPATLPSDKKKEKAQTLQEMIDQMLAESKEEMLLVEGDDKKDKTQFLITQEQARLGSPGGIGTIDITRSHLLKVANKYNHVVKDRLSPIFISVDNLMAALQSFYVNNRVASGEKASDECQELKGNVDAEVTAAKETRKK
jgi:hypothetical protein